MSSPYYNIEMLNSNQLNTQLNKQLLHDQKFTITTKAIKKIFVSGKCFVRIQKLEGLNMSVTSHDLLSCKVKNEELFIEPFSVYTWYCCIPLNYRNPKSRLDYSEQWNINAMFVVNTIVGNESNIFYMEDGFDKSLDCTKNGSGSITVNNLYASNVNCNVVGSGEIKCFNSNCYTFNGTIKGSGKIVSPKVKDMANCVIEGSGLINCVRHEKCALTQKSSKTGKINIISLFGKSLAQPSPNGKSLKNDKSSNNFRSSSFDL